MPLTAMQPSTRRPIMLGSAVVMFLAVSVLRFQLDGLEVPLSMLYVFPIAIVALEHDVLGGLLSSVAASAV